MNLLERWRSNGPKRILALDGGGVRGALTLGFLEKIEQILRRRHQNPQLLLCDYFDLTDFAARGSARKHSGTNVLRAGEVGHWSWRDRGFCRRCSKYGEQPSAAAFPRRNAQGIPLSMADRRGSLAPSFGRDWGVAST